jgi:hypothetical protein
LKKQNEKDMNTIFTIITYLLRILMATAGVVLFIILEAYVVEAADEILQEKGYNLTILLWGVYFFLVILQLIKYFVYFVKKLILEIWHTIF